MVGYAEELVQNGLGTEGALYLIDRRQLDYSTESLKVVDEVLLRIHRSMPEEDGGRALRLMPPDVLYPLVFRSSAYAGEVLRRQRPGSMRWQVYDNLSLADRKAMGAKDMLRNSHFLEADGEEGDANKARVLVFSAVSDRLVGGDKVSLHWFAREFLGEATGPLPPHE